MGPLFVIVQDPSRVWYPPQGSSPPMIAFPCGIGTLAHVVLDGGGGPLGADCEVIRRWAQDHSGRWWATHKNLAVAPATLMLYGSCGFYIQHSGAVPDFGINIGTVDATRVIQDAISHGIKQDGTVPMTGAMDCKALDPSGNTGRAGYIASRYSAILFCPERISGDCGFLM